jgi:hypothetical protein
MHFVLYIFILQSVRFEQCQWIVLTEDTATYGSEVVKMIHDAASAPATPDIVLLATDSAQHAQQGKALFALMFGVFRTSRTYLLVTLL